MTRPAPSPVSVFEGTLPVVLGQPHSGTGLPADVASALSPRGLLLADTDWHIPRLYEGLLPGASVVRTSAHRYVVDVNRDPSGQSLYPGQNTTGLCPEVDFDGESIYLPGKNPDEARRAERVRTYHRPYHEALARELERVRAIHGLVLLYDCHSIRGELPFLFAGRLPDLNLGTDGGKTADPGLTAAAVEACRGSGFSWTLNGRFRGGYTTRHHGDPGRGVHAIQMELVQSNYMSEAQPFDYQPHLAERFREVLAAILSGLLSHVNELAAGQQRSN